MSNPPPSRLPLYTRRQQYKLSGLSLAELNKVLTNIGIRLDQLSAIGQDVDMKGRWLRNVRVSATAIALGNPLVNGTWRFVVVGTRLKAQRREDNVWVDKGGYAP
ncbi:hypothetical protein LCGC14_0384550 [marine sediment metagenome]|uniref:Uncharacterized protein n=1 Tax=marine sediment metagenome TaxID=412755 RepID=A0A0F9VNM5_9ZZZZ